MPARPTPLSRRALMSGGIAVTALALVGCDAVDDLLDSDGGPGVSGAVTPTAPAVDADGDLVTTVLDAVTATGALATAVATAVPTLAGVATRLARLHEAHAAELGGADPAEAPVVPTGRAAALRLLVQAETRLTDRLVAAAGAAESGALAQVLASMAAAVAQRRAVLA